MRVRDVPTDSLFRFVGSDTIYVANGNGWHDIVGGYCGGPWWNDSRDVEPITKLEEPCKSTETNSRGVSKRS